MRTLLSYAAMVVMTLALAVPIVVLTFFGVAISPDGVLGRGAYWWSTVVLRVTGVSVRIVNPEHVAHGESRVYMSNHVSWWEIFALASVLPHFRMIGKKEISRIPLFGPAAGAVAAVWIDRKNRRTAFAAYEDVVPQVKAGLSVGVFPEGTRGFSYELRPFKKGPFVLAIAAQVPVVPVVSYGSLEIQKKGDVLIHPHPIELTFLEPIPTAGMNYDDRDRLIAQCWHAMADELEKHGVQSRGAAVEAAT